MKSFFALFVLTFFAGVLYAQEMGSTNYTITTDSINVGGLHSTSSSFSLEDTAGDIATGISTSTSFTLYAGYQKQQMSDISLIPGADVTMVGTLAGITGGTSNGSTTFTVISENDPGYMVMIQASSSPALASPDDSFADYTLAGANPDFTFSVAAGASEFGFSPEGVDIADRYKDNGSTCNTGSSDTAFACWDPLTTSDQIIVQRLSSTASTGSATILNFRATIGAGRFQQEGVYVATTTITILPL